VDRVFFDKMAVTFGFYWQFVIVLCQIVAYRYKKSLGIAFDYCMVCLYGMCNNCVQTGYFIEINNQKIKEELSYESNSI